MTSSARLLAILTLLLAQCALHAEAAAEVQYRTIALSGQAAPGAGGQAYGWVHVPAIDDAGRVAYFGVLERPEGVPRPYAMWGGAPGQTRLLVNAGDPAPGGGTFQYLGGVNLSADGRVVFAGYVDPQSGGQFVTDLAGGPVTALARRGQPAPGMPAGAEFFGVANWAPTVGRNGVHAFDAYVVGGGTTDRDHNGLWAGTPGDLRLLARSGHQAPGAPAGVVFDNNPAVSGVAISSPRVDRSGNVAFHGNLSGPGVTHLDDDGIWYGTRDGVRMIVRSGDAAPDTNGGVFLSTAPNIDAANGRVMFHATIPHKKWIPPGGAVIQSGDPVGPLPEPAIYAGAPDALRLVARSTSIAPGTEDEFGTFGAATMNGAGDVAFVSPVGLFLSRGGAVSPVMLTNAPAPGTPEGVRFNNALFPSINNLGQVAFTAHVQGPGVEDFHTRGIWATDLSGVLHLIAREGELFDVGGGDMRRIDSLEMWTVTNAGEDGMPSSFNDLGQVAFQAGFEDGSFGNFVATVPEPVGLATLVAAAGLLRRRRREQ